MRAPLRHHRRRLAAIGLVVGASLVVGACDYPTDPRGSLDRASDGTLRVVAVDHDPWVQVHDDGSVTGVEAELVERFADEVGAEVEYVPAEAEDAVLALEQGVADIAIGGFTSKSKLAKGVAMTRPYLDTAVLLARPADGDGDVRDADDQRIWHDARDIETAALIAKAGGRPRPSDDLPSEDGVLAAHDWEVEAWSLDRGSELHAAKHVLFAETGENRLTSRLERFLDAQREQVRAALERDAAEQASPEQQAGGTT